MKFKKINLKEKYIKEDDNNADFELDIFLNTAAEGRRETAGDNLDDFIVVYPQNEEEFFHEITDNWELADWEDINTEKELKMALTP